ncbi:MAG: aldo/keto reductase [Anaerolineae bacterium]|nr:aldo/keto reductase [Anaerolineae bacterium]
MSGKIIHHPFGRIGHISSRVIFGAAALSKVTQAEADATLDLLLEYGINHIDTAASYGEAEDRMGPWMQRGLRKAFFLATKTGDRTYIKARDSIHKSLERMKVDSFDLIQLHCLIDQNEWDVAMGPGGALEACIEAKQQGLVKYIGVTGHELRVPRMHLQSLQRYDFDSVLLPWNYVLAKIPPYASDFETLLGLCKERNLAVQTIKSITRAPWPKDVGDKKFAATWYVPFTDQADVDTAVSWLLSRPGVFLNSVGDIHILPKVLHAAARFSSGELATPSKAQMEALLVERNMSSLFV